MKTLKFFAMAVAAVLSLACTPEVVDSLTMGSTEINVPYQGTEQTLEFKANTAWKVEADQDWVTFDVAEGAAGDASVVMTVAANTTYEARTAVVTVTAGSLFTEYVIKQGHVTEFGAEVEYNFDYKAQTLEVAVNTNAAYEVTLSEGAESWITSEAFTKAAPKKETLTFNISLNKGEDRTAQIIIATEEATQTVVVNQTAFEGTVLTSVSAKFFGQTQFIYDHANWVYPEFDEYYVELSNETGDKLTLSLNTEIGGSPVGEFYAGSANHEVGTFTVTDGSVKYYTGAVLAGNEVQFLDGLVVVSVKDGNYNMVANLIAEDGTTYGFLYDGAIEEIVDMSYGAEVFAECNGQYQTYFTTKANEWGLQFYFTKSDDCDVFVRYISVDLFAAESAVFENGLPEGVYEFATPENSSEFTYANGIKLANPGNLVASYGNDAESNTLNLLAGSKLTVVKNTDGTYNFAFDLKFQQTTYDEENNTVVLIDSFDYKTDLNNVEVIESKSSSQIVLDEDAVFSTTNVTSQYSGMYWGDKWETGGATITIGYSGNAINANYEIYLTFNQSAPYVYEKNYANRFCNTPLETGVYTFSKTPAAGQRNLLPVKYGSNVYSYVKNGYTGSKMPITGGSITLNADSIVYDLECTIGDKVCKFTGSHPASLMLLQDYTSKAKNLNLVE